MPTRRAKLTNGIKEVTFDVLLSESVNRSARITDKTVEDGSNINDHIQLNSFSVPISCRMTTNAFINLQQLISFFESKEILTYIGRNSVSSVSIESLDTNHPRDNIGGFDFVMVLKQIRFTVTQETEIVPPALTTVGNRTANSTNEGTQQTSSAEVDAETQRLLEKEAQLEPQLDTIDNWLRERGY